MASKEQIEQLRKELKENQLKEEQLRKEREESEAKIKELEAELARENYYEDLLFNIAESVLSFEGEYYNYEEFARFHATGTWEEKRVKALEEYFNISENSLIFDSFSNKTQECKKFKITIEPLDIGD